MDITDGAHGFRNVITTTEQLAELYRRPSDVVMNKDTHRIDEGVMSFLERSTFVLVGTSSADGKLDVSPRGGPAGFVKAIDDHRLVIPDMNGNNRLDTIRNIVENPEIALLFLVPGLGETLRLNGRACITTDDEILDLFTDELRRPKSAIGVNLEEAYLHCAKSFRRGGIWDPETWPEVARRPNVGQILIEHTGMETGMSDEEWKDMLEKGYAADLAADAPEPTGQPSS